MALKSQQEEPTIYGQLDLRIMYVVSFSGHQRHARPKESSEKALAAFLSRPWLASVG